MNEANTQWIELWTALDKAHTTLRDLCPGSTAERDAYRALMQFSPYKEGGPLHNSDNQTKEENKSAAL